MKLHTHNRGLSLIEVLIALLVLSIGLMGIAALHLTSLKAAHSSYYRSLASIMAVDAEERAWIELGEQGSLTSSSIDGLAVQWISNWNDACPGSCTLLPNMDPSMSAASTTGNEWIDVEIIVNWGEGRFEDVDGTESFGYTARVLRGNP